MIHKNKVGTKVSHVLSNIMKSEESVSAIIKFILKVVLVSTNYNMPQVPSKASSVQMKPNIYHGK